MSASGPGSRAKPAPSLITPSRVIVFTLLAGALLALAIDLIARSNASAAFNAVDPFRLSNEQLLGNGAAPGAAINSQRVRELIGKAPSGPAFEAFGQTCEDYTWGGIFNTYRVRVYYFDKAMTKMIEAELNPDVSGENQQVQIVGQ